jgi:hypothetical protein
MIGGPPFEFFPTPLIAGKHAAHQRGGTALSRITISQRNDAKVVKIENSS